MTNHFTTLEFSDVLKQHGIEIDTIFVHYDNRVWASHLNNYDVYTLIDTDTASMVISSNIETKPAYLLSQVLGWLPETFMIEDRYCKIHSTLHKGKVYIGWSGENEDGSSSCCTSCMEIEWLITQGLTEGWLTKEIIEQQIKQNQ